MNTIGKTIIVLGAILIILGVIIMVFSKLSGGRGAPLPGDIVIHRDKFTLYFPIATSIVISIILTLIIWVAARLFRPH